MFKIKTAFRYAFSKTRGQRTTSVMILVGIAIGLVALLVISAVMNGLQEAQLDQLRNLESFDLIVESKSLTKDDIASISGVDMAFNFLETNALITNQEANKSQSFRIRAYDSPILLSDRLSESFSLLNGKAHNLDGLLISYTTRYNLSANFANDLKVTLLSPGRTATIVPYNIELPVSGFYSSRMTEFSVSTVFMDYETLANILAPDASDNQIVSGSKIGVYINLSKNQGKIQKNIVKTIMSMDPKASVTTWQEYNKALYSALMLEKVLMYIFLCFMFLIICVNLKNSTKRLLRNKQKEGAMLRALGCTRSTVNYIFLAQGVIICLLGEILGVILGKIFIANIQSVLALIDKIVSLFVPMGTILTAVPISASIGNLEIFLICLFIFVLSFIFTAVGCKRIYKSEIMEVILNASY